MTKKSVFGERLQTALQSQGFSRAQFATEMDMNLSLLYKYLRGDCAPSLPTVNAIADKLNCSLQWLCGFSDERGGARTANVPFDERFRELLSRMNVTRYRLIKDTGLSKQSVDGWFHGTRNPSFLHMQILSKYFSCTMDYLAGREN